MTGRARTGIAISLVLASVAAGLLGAAHCRADEVTDSINEALQQYKAGDLNDAAGTLDYAAELVRQKRGQELKSLLPEPLRGWTAGEATSQVFGTAMFGGMVSAERRYEKGDGSVTVKIVTDSPLLQSMIAMFANPIIAGMGAGELLRIKGHKALIHYSPDEHKGELNVVVSNKYLVSVEGHGLAREDLVSYASGVAYERLGSF
ncbi:MAG: hypothetical protein AB9873_09630 [Syntrophobacteraceae bacterium]